ncbi:MAG: hypothetical protein MUE52_19030 [Tabrizicola sp.]|nr:hypothetical protein [Tabrizicola sp.]
MKTPALALSTLLLAGAAQAETVLSEVTGNWAGSSNAGFFFRAVLSQEGDYLRLRIHQGMAADEIEAEPQFDNDRIAYAPGGGAGGGNAWLEVGSTGALHLIGVSTTEGYAYSEALSIQFMDNQFTVMAYGMYNNGPDSVASMPETPVGCWAEGCYSCEADLWNQTALAGGEMIAVPPHDSEAANASAWTPERVYELGYCPAPN